MGCLFALMALVFPRTVLFIFWIARPERVDAVFSSFVWPVLGVIFVPYATLAYVLLYLPGTGITGADWGWVVFAGMLDVLHWITSASRRRQISYQQVA